MRVMPTYVNLECSVSGCGARFSIPVVYRLELLPGPAPSSIELGVEVHPLMNTRVVVDVDATLDLEAPLRVHLDEHATCGAPPVVEPPAWPEVEWCDGGASCEHGACLDDARLEAEATGW